MGLLERARDRVGTYSLGMRQRLGIAASLMRSPKLLVLDEPGNGLDPAGIRDLRALVAGLPASGVTVLYSSHLLAEVEEVCNRVAIVNNGTIAFEGRLDELRASFGEAYRLETATRSARSALPRRRPRRRDSRTAPSGSTRPPRRSTGSASRSARRTSDPPARSRAALARGSLLQAHRGAGRMSLLRAYGWELRKLVRQKRTFAGLLAAVLYALAFVIALSVKKHAGIPPDIPLAKQVTKTAVVLPLALLAFATFFGAPVDLVTRRRRHRRLGGLEQHTEDDPHALDRPQHDLRRESTRRGDLRRRADRDAARRLGCRLDDRVGPPRRSAPRRAHVSGAHALALVAPRMPRTSCRSPCS